MATSNFGRVADYRKGPFGSALKKEIFVPKGDGTVKIYEQQNAINKDWRLERYYVSKDYALKLKNFRVKGGDILVSCAGTIGELYILPKEAENGLINQALMRIRVHDDINQNWFCYAFSNMIKDFSNKYSNGSAIKNIPPFSDLKSYCLTLPPIKEQNKIATFLSLLDAQIETQNKIIEDLRTYKNALVERYFSACEDCIGLNEILSERKTYSEKGLEYEHVTLSKEGIIPKGERYDRDFLVKDESKEYKITKLNDVCYNPANFSFNFIKVVSEIPRSIQILFCE